MTMTPEDTRKESIDRMKRYIDSCLKDCCEAQDTYHVPMGNGGRYFRIDKEAREELNARFKAAGWYKIVFVSTGTSEDVICRAELRTKEK